MTTILSTTRKVSKNKISGKIIAVHEGRKYKIGYESINGHAEQWGAPAEVLVGTYKTFENLINEI